MSTSKKSNDHCDQAALADFDRVRAKEGLGHMTLPRDFDELKVPLQLLAISNIERVDRGLSPILGLSKPIDARAQTGANNDEDPPFPPQYVGNYESSNWAGAGNSTLLDDFYWMYDDGPGSFNEDCPPAGGRGCWGHRDDILGARTKPLLMGAAVAYQHGTASMAEQFIGGDTTDKANVAPTWATIAKTAPVIVAAGKVTIVTHSAAKGGKSFLVRTYNPGSVTATVTAGASYWSVRPRSCHLAAGHACTLKLRFHSSKRGTHHGKLRVSGPGGGRTVTLIGRRAG
jgi:hypothetical protein